MSEEDYWATSNVSSKMKRLKVFDDDHDTIKLTNLAFDIDDNGDDAILPDSAFSHHVDDPGKQRKSLPSSDPCVDLLQKNRSAFISFSDSRPEERLSMAEQDKKMKGTGQVKEAVRNLVLGKEVSLEEYKSKESKQSLLQQVLHLHEGNAIIRVVLFLRETLKSSLFVEEMISHPEALDHYIYYLKVGNKFEDLEFIYGVTGQHTESAVLGLSWAVAASQIETKIKKLRLWKNSHLDLDPVSASCDHHLIGQYIDLYELQQPIEEADKKAESNRSAPFTEPRTASILNQSLITTLYYCCYYHFALKENHLASPHSMRRRFNLTDKQFVWIALRALSKRKHWMDIQCLFQTKGWLGGTILKAIIPFEKVISILFRFDAPEKVKSAYCNSIDDVESRIEVAKKYACHRTVMDTYKSQRDRQALRNYESSLPPNSEEAIYAQDILKLTDVKWKN